MKIESNDGFEGRLDSADALAERILQATANSIDAGEIEVEDVSIAYLVVAVKLLSACSPPTTVASILRANADVVEREATDARLN